MTAAETLDDLLSNLGITLRLDQVAEKAGISARNLHNLRRGLAATPRLATISKLAKALKVDPARVRAAIEASRAAASE